MHTKTVDIFRSKNYPEWFRNHPIFKEVKSVRKVFPAIGLSNCEKDVSIGYIVKDVANQCVRQMFDILNQIREDIIYRNRNVSIDNLKNINDISVIICRIINSDSFNYVNITDNKCSITLPRDIKLEGNTIFKKRESLFKVWGKLTSMLQEIGPNLPSLDSLEKFKEFNSVNIPDKKLKIVFSSTGEDGLFDIASMSSRGIKSCQSWDKGEYKYCTIGSLINPFVGIIYLTSKDSYNAYGSKMYRRCIVRFVVDRSTKKPVILLSKMYPNFDKAISKEFIDFLQEKTQLKVLPETYSNNLYNPDDKTTKLISRFDSRREVIEDRSIRISSYDDSKVQNKVEDGYGELTSFLFTIGDYMLSAMKRFYRQNINHYIFKLINVHDSYTVTDYSIFTLMNHEIAKAFINIIPKDQRSKRAILKNFLLKKSEIISGIKDVLVKIVCRYISQTDVRKLDTRLIIDFCNGYTKLANNDVKALYMKIVKEEQAFA